MTKLTCGHRLCGDCFKVADKCPPDAVSNTPGPSLNITQGIFIKITCPVTAQCGEVGKASVEVPLRRLPVQFASVLRLKALKREVECIERMGYTVTLAEAGVIRKRIQTIVDGGTEDLFNYRHSFVLRLSEHLQPLLEALFEVCNKYHRHSESPGVYFIDDATIRAILTYINSPVVLSHLSGQHFI